jgi:hypothetical protein
MPVFETDGWRDERRPGRQNRQHVFAQYEISHYRTSLQAEYRYRDNGRGDLEQTFWSDDLLPYLRQDDKTNSVRLGFRHGFAPGSDLIGNFQYSDGDRSLHDEDPDPEFTYPIFNFDLEGEDEAYSGELSYLFRSGFINIVGGAGYFDIDSTDQIAATLDFGIPPSLVLDQSDVNRDTKHTNLYLYTYIKPMDNLTLTVGGSGDFFEADDELVTEKDQFNPKIGVTWNFATGTTLRAAVFRVLKRTLITDQTLEPTQVAGFNQFFDEANATDYWRYGGAIDQKITSSIYGGLEFTHRDLNVPYVDFEGDAGPTLAEADWKENLVRAYFFWTPLNSVSLTAEYLFEDLDRDEQGGPGATESQTHYVPLGINYFHTSGLGVSLKGTYINQDGKYERKDDRGVFEEGEDNFWLFDAAINYRLPKRYGFIALGVNNLFDQEFNHFDSDWENLRIQPGRFLFAKVTLAFP